jgi:triacylglycerol lipase
MKTPRRMQTTRRSFVITLAASSTLSSLGSSSLMAQDKPLPIIFVHGNGDTAGLWITTLWRFESNGYPVDRLHAIDLKYPQARAVDQTPMPGRSSNAEVMQQVANLVTTVKAKTGADKVILIAQSRGGNTVRNYIKNGGGAAHTALAILCGAVNHGVIVSDKYLVGSEFNGASAFMQDLNSTPGEVVAGVRFVTIRSADNDKFAQPDGRHLGLKDVATGLGFDAPELKGAENLVLPKLDHRETGYAPEAFAAMYQVITGKPPASTTPISESAPILSGSVTGFEAGSPSNIGIAAAKLSIYRVAPETGLRQGDAALTTTTGADGRWGPFTAASDAFYEFVVEAAGQPTTHIYRSPFARSSTVVHIRQMLLAKGDTDAAAVVYISRPRGYFGAGRDTVELAGKPAAGIPDGVATTSISKVTFPDATAIAVPGRFNAERITARTWPMAENRVSVIELTY